MCKTLRLLGNLRGRSVLATNQVVYSNPDTSALKLCKWYLFYWTFVVADVSRLIIDDFIENFPLLVLKTEI